MKRFPLFILFICSICTSCEDLSKNNDEYFEVILTNNNSNLNSSDKEMEYIGENFFEQMLPVKPNLSDNEIEHRRLARHVEAAVTESIINHLMKKLSKRYPQVKKQPKSLKRMMNNLQQRLNKYIHKRKPNRTRPIRINKIIRKKVRKSGKLNEVLQRKPKRISLF